MSQHGERGANRGERRRLTAIGRDAGGYLLLLLVAGWLAAPAAVRAEEILDASSALARAEAGELVIIDVRTIGEWAETGLPQGAAAISLYPDWGVANENFVADVLAAVGADKTTPIATICARGQRSSRARDLLVKSGFTRVFSISEGMLGSSYGPGWLKRELPVEPCTDC